MKQNRSSSIRAAAGPHFPARPTVFASQNTGIALDLEKRAQTDMAGLNCYLSERKVRYGGFGDGARRLKEVPSWA